MLFLTLSELFFLYSIYQNNSSSFIEISPNQGDENQQDGAVLWSFSLCFPGTGATMQPKLVKLHENKTNLIGIGTDGGVALLNFDGTLNISIATLAPIIDFEMISDISGDSMNDIIIVTFGSSSHNVFAFSTGNAEILWSYVSIYHGIDPDLFAPKDSILKSWDAEVVEDVSGDIIPEIVVSSWNKIVLLNGRTGDEIWKNEDIENGLWKIGILSNMIIAGSENGELVVLQIESGKFKWQYKIPSTSRTVYFTDGTTEKRAMPNSINYIHIILWILVSLVS